MIDWVVSPVDQRYVLAAEEVSVTDPPAQNVVGPPGVIVGTAGALGPVNVCDKVFDVQPEASVKLIMYAPEPRFGMVAGSVIPVWLPEEVPDQLRVPVAEPVTWILPFAAEQVVGLVTVPMAITGLGFTTMEVVLAVELQPFTLVVTE